ncbi:MAG: AraC family transcriptional regulator [Noviherbaspirillum sp.]
MTATEETRRVIEKTTSAAWVKGIAETLAAAGVDVCAVFKDAEMDMALLTDPHARYATTKISILWEAAHRRSGNPAIALAASHVVRPASLDALAYTMMTSSNLLLGLERFERYLRVVSDATVISLHKDCNGYRLKLEIDGGGRPVPRQRADYILVTLLNILRWISGRNLHPAAVSFAHSDPADRQPYENAFQCPLHFNAPVYGLLLSTADLTCPLPTSNPVLAELHERYVGEYLDRLDNNSVIHSIRKLIIRQLPDGEPLRGHAAKALHMSERTLQRRLQEEGTSFHQLVDDIRRELARQYLTQPQITLAQVTYLLGFSDQSIFSRACKRWFDVPPRQYRDRIGKAG